MRVLLAMAFYRTAYSLVSTYVPQIAQRLLFGQPGVYYLNLSGICRSKGMCLDRTNILENQTLDVVLPGGLLVRLFKEFLARSVLLVGDKLLLIHSLSLSSPSMLSDRRPSPKPLDKKKPLTDCKP
jgi:hypothetical protein